MASNVPLVAVEPKSGRFESLSRAVVDGGGKVVSADEAQALVWADPSKPDVLGKVLSDSPELEWVALPFSGIEPYVALLDDKRVWTCARGVYARPVAEHALMLGLAGLRGMSTYARATKWKRPEGHNLIDGRVTIFGGGGIAQELIGLLAGFNCSITVVRRQNRPIDGADQVLGFDDRLEALDGADLVVLALALTPQTRHIISAQELEAMAPHAWLVNVARGGHVDSEALLSALENNEIGGACLDVTDPEPLPQGHPLWGHDRVMITPHIANTPEMGVPLLARHIQCNVERFASGQTLDGVIDTSAGY